MFEYIKKSLLTGVGMALRSKSEIEELAKEFAQTSKMSQEEAERFLEQCRQRYENARSDLDKKIETQVEQIIKKLDLATRSDVEALNRRMDELSRKLEGRE